MSSKLKLPDQKDESALVVTKTWIHRLTGLLSGDSSKISLIRRSPPSGLKIHSVGSTSAELIIICARAVPSFFWFLILFISAVAESKRLIPGQKTPFSFETSSALSFSSSVSSAPGGVGGLYGEFVNSTTKTIRSATTYTELMLRRSVDLLWEKLGRFRFIVGVSYIWSWFPGLAGGSGVKPVAKDSVDQVYMRGTGGRYNGVAASGCSNSSFVFISTFVLKCRVNKTDYESHNHGYQIYTYSSWRSSTSSCSLLLLFGRKTLW